MVWMDHWDDGRIKTQLGVAIYSGDLSDLMGIS